MITIIAGSRDCVDPKVLEGALIRCPWTITEVVSGCAKGADLLGERYAYALELPVKRYPADWTRYGKRAGPMRNVEMAEIAEACIVLWDGVSTGSQHMIMTAVKKRLPTLVCKYHKAEYILLNWRKSCLDLSF